MHDHELTARTRHDHPLPDAAAPGAEDSHSLEHRSSTGDGALLLGRRQLPLLGGLLVTAGWAGATTASAEADGGRGGDATRGQNQLRWMQAPGGRSDDGPIWSPLSTGFASLATEDLPQGTVGGEGGEVVVATDSAQLAEYVAADGPVIVLVEGSISVEPFGAMLDVSSDTSILGVGRGAEIVGGGLRLDQVRNVVIRNLTFRDSYIPGDWDGTSPENDNDGIRIDTSTHVWLDHNEFARLGDGAVDVRKDSTNVTISWCVFRDHNKTLGVGWTENLLTTLTLHHNRFSNTHQRNGSIDKVAFGHLYSNWLAGQSSYATTSRGGALLLVESSVYEHGRHPIGISDPESRIHGRDILFDGTWGDHVDTGPTFEASDHYRYRADPARNVVDLLTRHAGPKGRREKVGRRITVALDGSGDVASIHAAVGAAWRSGRRGRAPEIVVRPGHYREVVTVWPGVDGLTIRGETGDPADVVISYDKPAADWATATVLADRVTLRALTIENAYDAEENGPAEAIALRTAGDHIVLEDVVLSGTHDTTDPRRHS